MKIKVFKHFNLYDDTEEFNVNSFNSAYVKIDLFNQFTETPEYKRLTKEGEVYVNHTNSHSLWLHLKTGQYFLCLICE